MTHMSAALHGANTIEVNGTAMLLTVAGGGLAVHLTRAAEPGVQGREAVPAFYFKRKNDLVPERLKNYDLRALLDPRWSAKTLCGRTWAIMIGGDGGSVSLFNDDSVGYVPTCRRCLAVMDRDFPKPVVDPRLPLVAQIATDIVVGQRGYAQIDDVPGPQQQELRKAIRRLVRQRTGHSIETHASNGSIHIVCRPIHEEHLEEGLREAAEVMGAFLSGEPAPPRQRDWVISWSAWDVG